jgi:hypothetical protein
MADADGPTSGGGAEAAAAANGGAVSGRGWRSRLA